MAEDNFDLRLLGRQVQKLQGGVHQLRGNPLRLEGEVVDMRADISNMGAAISNTGTAMKVKFGTIDDCFDRIERDMRVGFCAVEARFMSV
jgi:hypothetical protein